MLFLLWSSRDILNDFYGDSFTNQRKPQEGFHSYDSFYGGQMDFMSEVEEMFNNFFKGFPMMTFPQPEGTVQCCFVQKIPF